MQKSYFILDDNVHAVKQIETLMKGYKCYRHAGSETSPERAIPLILSQKPDILFIDVEMPGITGIEVVTRIQREAYEAVVIFVTAYEKYAVEAIRRAAFDYLLKPVDKEEMERLVKRLDNYYSSNDKMDKNELLSGLTPREKEVFELLRACMTTREIAERLSISTETVYTYRRRIIKKLRLTSTKKIPVQFPPKK